ncbi:MAG: hypothetical protein K9N46_04505 [Candidatus Marinimicrobia bacterium]|nr:hypothetical protein [Candidatus Neomarinimicrobiota bacterium]MCF7829351.1 hypothetical protein [Candidatus Neomarinimicrobiota bacterium]MCF7879986.1 hypothetical protein [Candidatus Neomarinimicrobiota bacterium]
MTTEYKKIPIQINIGITGHRNLDDIGWINSHLEYFCKDLIQQLQGEDSFKDILTVYSALADGADQIVAENLIKNLDANLNAILPMDKTEYKKEFQSKKAQLNFEKLIKISSRIIVEGDSTEREEAFLKSGKFIVNNCDILIALWDGKPANGKGGTAEIVSYANEVDKPIFWVNTQDYSAKYLNSSRQFFEVLKKVNEFNSERIHKKKLKKEVENYKKFVTKKLNELGPTQDGWNEYLRDISPILVKSNMLSTKYHNLYYAAGTSIYLLSTFAILIASLQIIFFPAFVEIISIEVISIILLIVVYWLSRKFNWHHKWLSYRSLTENLRIFLFLKLIGKNVPTIITRSDFILVNDRVNHNFIKYLDSIINKSKVSLPLNKTKNILSNLIISEQINYHRKKMSSARLKEKLFSRIGVTLFILTLFSALMHLIHLHGEFINKLFAAFTIGFPTIGAALTAIKNQREYKRDLQRSEKMIEKLAQSSEQLKDVNTLSELDNYLFNLQEILLSEQRNWRFIYKYHELETAA